MSLPVVGLEGRVTGEVSVKFTDAGTAALRMRVKAADRRKGEDGRWVDAEVLWVTVTAYGQLAEHAAESLRDGDQVVAVGKWSTAEWTEADGTKKTAPRFVASALGAGLQFAARRHHDSAGRPVQQQAAARPTQDAPDVGTYPSYSGSGDPWAV